jgi:nicotinamidase-related amidase
LPRTRGRFLGPSKALRDALLLVDLIDDFRHEDGEALLGSFRARQPNLVRVLAGARGLLPVIYANDMRDRWDSDAPGYVAHIRENGLGGELVAEVAPRDGDMFVFKPRYSAFDATPLEILLEGLRIERLLLAGNATEMCVTQTAIAARELGFKVNVLADCCATLDPELEEVALRYLEHVVGAHVERYGAPHPGKAEPKEVEMPDKRPSVKNEKQYEALKEKGMSKERAARIANSPGASSRGGKKSGSGGDAKQGGTTAQKKAAGRKGGRATARKRS